MIMLIVALHYYSYVRDYMYIEDFTQVVISYEMTMSIRFCLSHDCLKLHFIAIRMNNNLMRKHIVDTNVIFI